MTLAKRNLKEQILALRQAGKTLREIKQALQCSFSTIAYHLYKRTKNSTAARINREQRRVYNHIYCTKHPRGVIYAKHTQFFRAGHRYKMLDTKLFTLDDLLKAIPEKPTCYLTGAALNLSDSASFSLDHVVPVSKGGSNALTNLGLCTSTANRAKNDLLLPEFISLCRQVLLHHGFKVSEQPKNNP